MKTEIPAQSVVSAPPPVPVRRRPRATGDVPPPPAPADADGDAAAGEPSQFRVRPTDLAAFGLSTLLHTILLLVLGLWIVEQATQKDEVASIAAGETQGLPDALDLRTVPLPNESSSRKPDSAKQDNRLLATLPPREVDGTLPASLLDRLAQSDGEGQDTPGDGDQTGDKGGAIAKGGKPTKNAVSKGRFTVWTLPEDPEVEQAYMMFIRVQLPENVKRFKATALSGVILGTDGHRQFIPWDNDWPGHALHLDPRNWRRVRILRRNGYIPVQTMTEKVDGKDRERRYATLIVLVPGSSEAKTVDTIRTQWKHGKVVEKEELKLVF